VRPPCGRAHPHSGGQRPKGAGRRPIPSETEAVEVLGQGVANSCDMRGLISHFSDFLLGVGAGGWGKVRMKRGFSLGWGAYTTWVRTPKRRPTLSKAVRALSR